MSKQTTTRDAVKQRLYRRGVTGRYYVDLRDLGGEREALVPEGESYATTDEVIALSLAGKKIEELQAKLRGEHFGGLKRIATIGTFSREWIVYRRSFCDKDGFASSRTIKRYEQALRQLFYVIDEDARMDRVTTADAKQALAALSRRRSRSGQTLKASSLRQVLAAMQLIYDHAQDEGVVPMDYNPWRAIRRADRPKPPKTSATDFLEIPEAAALIEACDALDTTRMPLRTIVATLLLTGARKDEILGLEVKDVDLRRRVIHIHANRWRKVKTRDERFVPLWPQLEEELKRYLERSPRGHGLLFPSEDSDERRDVMITAINKNLRKARDVAAEKLDGADGAALVAKQVTPRSLRPTYCAARLQTLDHGQPVALWTVKKELGHGSMQMIDRVYGRLGVIRHRSGVVEYRLDSDAQK